MFQNLWTLPNLQYLSTSRINVEAALLDDDVRAMIHEFARQLSEGEATKADLIPRTCKICKNVKTVDVLAQLNIDKSELGEDCQSCIGSEVE